MYRISIIVPVYKAEQYLRPCIDSILAQTYTDFELVLVDDGSPDNCGAICDEYATKDSRVKVIHQRNQGQAAARNAAVKMALGEWVCFVDSDDVIHPQMLDSLYRAASMSDAGISMCSAVEAEELPGDFLENKQTEYRVAILDERTLESLFDHGEHRPWVIWGKLIRKEIVKKLPFAAGRIYEDNAVVCRWLVEAKKAADVHDRMYFYRVNRTGTTKSSFELRHLDYLWALEEMMGFFEGQGYLSLKKRFCTTYMTTAAWYYGRVRDELGMADKAHEISKQMRMIYRRNRKYIELSDEQRRFVYTAMFPRGMQVYWLCKAGADAVKRDGLWAVLRKLLTRCIRGEDE